MSFVLLMIVFRSILVPLKALPHIDFESASKDAEVIETEDERELVAV